MGIFVTVDQRDYETIASVEYDVDEVFTSSIADLLPDDDATVVFQLRRYELYERILWSSSRTEKTELRVVVEGKRGFCPLRDEIIRDTLAEKQSAWPTDEGPRRGWEFQVTACCSSLRTLITAEYGDVTDFKDAVNGYVGDSDG